MNIITVNDKSKLNLVEFFRNIKLKKHYINQFKNKIALLNLLKENNFKTLNSELFFYKKYNNTNLYLDDITISYIIDITFSKTNTYVHVMDFSGNLKFFYSAGFLQYKGKRKRFNFKVVEELYKNLVLKFHFLRKEPIALHFKNLKLSNRWILRLMKKKLFIRVVKFFGSAPHNGCRKKKIRRKKQRKKQRNKSLIA